MCLHLPHKVKWEFHCHADKDMKLESYLLRPFGKLAYLLCLDLLRRHFPAGEYSVLCKGDVE